MSDSSSRYEQVSRRRFMKGSLAAAGIVALEPLLAACGNNDAKAFSQSSSSTTVAGAPTSAAAQATTSAPAAGTAGGGTIASTAGTVGTANTVAGSGPAFPKGGQLVVKFSFTPGNSGGRVNNPFVVVWIENASGTLVKTVSLWYLPREGRYVNELRRWYVAESASTQGQTVLDSVSGATRAPGAYSVMWDGTDDASATVPQGDYFVCIEAAREHGPYELIREKVTIGAKAFATTFTDQGELTAASADFTV